MSRIALIDVETTGLDPHIHEIVEIGCVIFDSHTLKIEKTWEKKVWPRNLKVMDPKAIAVNGYDGKVWLKEKAVHLEVAMKELSTLAGSCIFMAYNVAFDYGFVNAAAKKAGVPFPGKHYKLDLLTIAYMKLPHSGMMRWSMKEVAQACGLEPEPEVHRALNGAMKEYEIYKALMK